MPRSARLLGSGVGAVSSTLSVKLLNVFGEMSLSIQISLRGPKELDTSTVPGVVLMRVVKTSAAGHTPVPGLMLQTVSLIEPGGIKRVTGKLLSTAKMSADVLVTE